MRQLWLSLLLLPLHLLFLQYRVKKFTQPEENMPWHTTITRKQRLRQFMSTDPSTRTEPSRTAHHFRQTMQGSGSNTVGSPVDALTRQEPPRPQQERQHRDGLAQTGLIAQHPTPHLMAGRRRARPHHPIHHVYPQFSQRQRRGGGRRGRRHRSASGSIPVSRTRLPPLPMFAIAVYGGGGGGAIRGNSGVDRDELGVGAGVSALLSCSHPPQPLWRGGDMCEQGVTVRVCVGVLPNPNKPRPRRKEPGSGVRSQAAGIMLARPKQITRAVCTSRGRRLSTDDAADRSAALHGQNGSRSACREGQQLLPLHPMQTM